MRTDKKLFNLIKNNKLLVVLIILTLIKLIFCSLLTNYSFNNLQYDDALMEQFGLSLSNGDWLGNYGEQTLIKGFVYSFIVGFSQTIGISVNLILSIIYILSTLFFCYSIKDTIKNKKYIYIIYLLLLLNPLSFSMGLMQRIYRNSLILSQTLFILGSIFGIYGARNDKKKLPIWSLFLSVFLVAIIFTREDILWIVPLVLGILILVIVKSNLQIKQKIFITMLPIIMIIVSINLVCLINYKYYKIYTTNELTNTYFEKAYLDILKIEPDSIYKQVSINKSTLKKLLEISPTLNKLNIDFDSIFKRWNFDDKEINSAHTIWFFRNTIYYYAKFKDGKEANLFWKKVYFELEKAFEEEKIEKRIIFSSVFMTPPNSIYTKDLLTTFVKANYYVISYKDVMSTSKKNLITSNKKYYIENFSKRRGFPTLILEDYNNAENIVKLKYDNEAALPNIIALIYKIIAIPISILGIISFILLKKREEKIILSLIILSYILIVGGITYTHVTAFNAIRYYYLGPAYILLLIFNLLSITLYLEEKNGERFNNITALFKRNRKFRKVHK